MSTLSVARKDLLDVRRSKTVWAVGALYTLFAVLFFYLGQISTSEPDVIMQLLSLASIGALFIPLIALVTAYLAIAGERESGSIKYLLSLPNTRRDVVLGKYLSRGAVVGAAIVFAFAVGAVLTLLWYPSLEAATFARVVGLTLLFTLAYVAVAIGISAATSSRSRAMGGAIGFYFVGNLLMVFPGLSIVGLFQYALNDRLGLGISEHAFEFVRRLSPTVAYEEAMPLAFPNDEITLTGTTDVPAYLEPEVAVLVLVAWLVVPVALGLWHFDRVDLG
ncbi:ABC transporter permease [Halopiger aswanensis]|uniref:ABC-2 type transport system permease protein n=1 Tax=Halopiger aswanensis TaxID=148449 RepID=A0A3R7GWB3_9EURY|nr:ABC transporter permease subunit [Halopiger aswanensis]RKD95577.1 ABC-2 type transport system permease protein [Halopiger aswanensis]